jgi:hypothetical protein
LQQADAKILAHLGNAGEQPRPEADYATGYGRGPKPDCGTLAGWP